MTLVLANAGSRKEATGHYSAALSAFGRIGLIPPGMVIKLMPAQHADEAGSADRNIVALQLARILSSPDFINAGKLAAFLEYVITKSLAGKAEHIKEYTIGVDVFGKPESFDPRLDTLVRVQASKLRGRLEKYYSGQGLEDPIRIELPAERTCPW